MLFLHPNAGGIVNKIILLASGIFIHVAWLGVFGYCVLIRCKRHNKLCGLVFPKIMCLLSSPLDEKTLHTILLNPLYIRTILYIQQIDMAQQQTNISNGLYIESLTTPVKWSFRLVYESYFTKYRTKLPFLCGVSFESCFVRDRVQRTESAWMLMGNCGG